MRKRKTKCSVSALFLDICYCKVQDHILYFPSEVLKEIGKSEDSLQPVLTPDEYMRVSQPPPLFVF